MDEAPEAGKAYFVDDNCEICGEPTVKPALGDVEAARQTPEPFICGVCLVDLHRAGRTRLTDLQRLATLETKVDNRLYNTNLFLIGLTLALGYVLGVVTTLLLS